MWKKTLCSSCHEVLEPTDKDMEVCGNCGEINCIGSEDKAEFEPSITERLREAHKMYHDKVEEMGVPGKYFGSIPDQEIGRTKSTKKPKILEFKVKRTTKKDREEFKKRYASYETNW